MRRNGMREMWMAGWLSLWLVACVGAQEEQPSTVEQRVQALTAPADEPLGGDESTGTTEEETCPMVDDALVATLESELNDIASAPLEVETDSDDATDETPDDSAEDAEDPGVLASTWDVVDQYDGSDLCDGLRAGENPEFPDAHATMTSECTDFCDTFQPEGADAALLWSTWLTWVSWIPEPIRSKLGNGIGNRLGIPGMGSKSAGNAMMCVPQVLGYLAAEAYDQQACQRGSQCVACGNEAHSRTACRVWDAIRTCAQVMGVKIPLNPVGFLARTCGAGCVLQREAYRNICREACLDSLDAALPVAQPENGERRCCSCDRDHYVDYTFPWTDEIIRSDFYNSVTADTDEPTSDCEGKEDTYFYPPGASYNGYPIYYHYTNCHKYMSTSGQCHSDSNGHHG